jgi:hypothetical protein
LRCGRGQSSWLEECSLEPAGESMGARKGMSEGDE